MGSAETPGTTGTPGVEVRRSKRRRRTVSAYREGEAHRRADPGVVQRGRRGRVGRHDGAPHREGRGARGAERRGPAGAGPAAQRRLPRRSRHPGVGALGVEPELPLGLVHAVATARSGSPSASRRCRAGSSTTSSSTSWRTCSSLATTRGFWAWVDRYPKARKAQGYLLGLVGGSADHSAAGVPGLTRRCRPGQRQPHERLAARGRAGRRPATRRTSSDSSLTACSAPSRATARCITSRWCTPSPGPQNGTRCASSSDRYGVQREIVGAEAGLLERLAQGGGGQGGVAGLGVAAELEPPPDLGVQRQQHPACRRCPAPACWP